jgi:hypothetical protein
MAAQAGPRHSRCPKCGHRPLPQDQSLPAACPACGVILAKLGTGRAGDGPPVARSAAGARGARRTEPGAIAELLLHLPERVDAMHWWSRLLLLVVFALWGLSLIALDHREGGIGATFLHGPLLLFHEAGHVLFRPFGEWLTVAGGTLLQLLLPLLLMLALLLKHRDPFGAAFALWLLGVSLLDVAPYLYDALHPKLVLLSGATGEAGGHDWIYLLESMGLRPRAQALGTAMHRLGALVLLAALGWAAWLLVLQRRRLGETQQRVD